MLVLLSGIEPTHKKTIGAQVLRYLVGKVDLGSGYTADFTTHPYSISDGNGKVVFKTSSGEEAGINELLVDLDNDGAYDEAGHAIFNAAEAFHERVFVEGGADSHYKDALVDVYQDYGFCTDPKMFNYPVASNLRQVEYNDIIDDYNKSPADVHLLTGSFGKHIIDRLRTDLGTENVIVINILRNPSVAFLLNEKPDSYYEENNMTKFADSEKLRRSIMNAMHLSQFDDIVTVKFEDILRDQSIEVNGLTIPLEGIEKGNALVTKKELEEFLPQKRVSASALTEFNALYSDFEHTAYICGPEKDVARMNTIQGTNFTVEDFKEAIPSNIFDAIGYTPLTYSAVEA